MNQVAAKKAEAKDRTKRRAMRALLLVQARLRPVRAPSEYVEILMDELDCTRSTAFRYVAAAFEVLGAIPLERSAAAQRLFEIRHNYKAKP